MIRPNIETDALYLFDMVMRTRSLTKAAEACGMSVGSASRVLSKLRLSFRDELFLRTKAGLMPTPKAEALAADVSDLLGRYEHFFDETVFRPEDANRIFRIACVDNALYTFLSPVISQLLERAPSIGIEIKPIKADFCEALTAGDIDFAVYPTAPASPHFHHLELARDVFVLVCGRGHPLGALAKERALTLADFQGYRQVKISTAPMNLGGDLWSDAETQIPMEAGDVAVWSPFFIPIAQILRTTSLWGAVPVQLANRLKALMPDLVILGRPRTAEVFTPRLIWHERLHRDPAAEWVRSVILSSAGDTVDVDRVPFIED